MLESGHADGMATYAAWLVDAGRLAAEAEARRLVVTEGRGSEWLWRLLVVQDQPDEAYRVLRHGLNPDGSTASSG